MDEIKLLTKKVEELGELIGVLLDNANLGDEYGNDLYDTLHRDRCPICLNVETYSGTCGDTSCSANPANA